MNRNLDSKIEEIRKLLNCWIYRTLTPYGKLVIIKTLALSKLSHAALVIPTLNKNKIKEVETIMFRFLWGNKPDKVSREDAKLSEKAGGLGMIDLKDFWQSFKFSWIRRLTNTNAFWPKILVSSVSEIISKSCSLNEILEMGPSKLQFIGKKMHNRFWGEVFGSVMPIMQGAYFCTPEKIFQSSFWDNPKILRSNKPIKKNAFPILANTISNVIDFYKLGTSRLMTYQEFRNHHLIDLDIDTYTELSYILSTSIRSLGIIEQRIPVFQLPVQPVIVNIATLTEKGCNVYYRMLRKKKNLVNNIHTRESKWHLELGTAFGVDFWNKAYIFTAEIKNNNYIKWLHYQIVRNSLFTNYRVHQIKRHISPLCTACSAIEKVSHVFWDCDLVWQFWQEVQVWLQQFNVSSTITKNMVLFGFHKESSSSKINVTLLLGKTYIWKNKFRDTALSINAFKKSIKKNLDDLKHSYEYLGKEILFDQWNLIYASLL